MQRWEGGTDTPMGRTEMCLQAQRISWGLLLLLPALPTSCGQQLFPAPSPATSQSAELPHLLGHPLSPKTWGNMEGRAWGSDLGLEKLSISPVCASAASSVEKGQWSSCFGKQQCSGDGNACLLSLMTHSHLPEDWAPPSCSAGTQRVSEVTGPSLPSVSCPASRR